MESIENKENSPAQILEQVLVVSFEAKAVTGVISDDGPETRAFTGRGVRYVGPACLKAFTALRQATHAGLLRMGTRFLSGYAIPVEKGDAAAAFLASQAAAWESAKAEVVTNFDSSVSEWVAANPEVEPHRGRFPSTETIAARTGFTWTTYRVEPSEAGKSGMDSALSGLQQQILREIAQDVASSWSPGAQRMNAKHVGIIARCADKLRGLAFVGGPAGPIAGRLAEVLASLPRTGTMNAAEAGLAGTVLALLSNEQSALTLVGLDLKAIDSFAAPSAPLVFEGDAEVAPESAQDPASADLEQEHLDEAEPVLEPVREPVLEQESQEDEFVLTW